MSEQSARSRDPLMGKAGLGVTRVKEAPTAEQAEAVFESFLQIMGQAAAHSEIGERLAFADIVSHIYLRDSPQNLVVTLFFDRKPVEVADHAVGTADVDLYIDTNDVLRFWTGDMHLAIAILNGEVEYRGPVRKLLRIVPIARRLVADFQKLAVQEGLTSENGTPPAT